MSSAGPSTSLRASVGGADLHLHSTFSDGTATPEEVVRQAREQRLEAIALTDHDTLDGLADARRAGEAAGIEVIAGVEFGTPCDEGAIEETHIVGLFLDPQDATLQAALARYRRLRHERAMQMVEKLNRAGLQLRSDEVLAMAGNGSVSRLHVARALVKSGHVKSISTAFRHWLAADRPGFVPRIRPPASETIALIHNSGGIAVLAHPGKSDRDVEIAELISSGLDAIEAYCPEHRGHDQARYLETAARLGLLVSGGSDWHGSEKDHGQIGSVRLEREHVEALRRRAQEHREHTHG